MAELDRNPRYAPIAQEQEIAGALADVYAEWPALGNLGFEVVDSRDVGMSHPRNLGGGRLEFYPPDEHFNPNPGVPTIEVFDPKGTGKRLRNWLFGDMLHHAPEMLPRFGSLREAYRRTITEEQQGYDRNAFEKAQKKRGEYRAFGEWFEVSRLDAHIRGYIAEQWTQPNKAGEAAWPYTDQQRMILEEMKGELKRSNRTERVE